MWGICDISFIVPLQSNAFIQEIHTTLGHKICGAVEKEIVLNA